MANESIHHDHCAIPSGIGVFGKKTTWLNAALDDAEVPAESALQQFGLAA